MRYVILIPGTSNESDERALCECLTPESVAAIIAMLLEKGELAPAYIKVRPYKTDS